MSDNQPTFSRRQRRNLTQFINFGLVGGSGVLVNLLVEVVLNKANGGSQNSTHILWPHLLGTPFNLRFSTLTWILAFLVANFTNFQLNRSWTFREIENRRGWWQEFWPFFWIGGAAAFLGIFIKAAMNNPTSPVYLPEPFFHESSGLHSREYWSHLITIVITTPINFGFNKIFTFVSVREHPQAEPPMVASVVAPELVDADGEVRAAPAADTRGAFESLDVPERKG